MFLFPCGSIEVDVAATALIDRGELVAERSFDDLYECDHLVKQFVGQINSTFARRANSFQIRR